MKIIFLFLLTVVALGCSSSDESSPSENPGTEAMYFPDNGTDVWETKDMTTLNWNEAELQPLLDYLEEKHSRSFIIVVNGRIVMEKYFNGHTATTP